MIYSVLRRIAHRLEKEEEIQAMPALADHREQMPPGTRTLPLRCILKLHKCHLEMFMQSCCAGYQTKLLGIQGLPPDFPAHYSKCQLPEVWAYMEEPVQSCTTLFLVSHCILLHSLITCSMMISFCCCLSSLLVKRFLPRVLYKIVWEFRALD